MKIERANLDNADVLSQVAISSFMDAVAPTYGPEGIEEFRGYASRERISERLSEGNAFYMAKHVEKVVGMAEFRLPNHLAMLFVLSGHQRQGIGRALLDQVIEEHVVPSSTSISVAATPNSISAYEHFGFVIDGNTQEVNGIVFTPMRLLGRGSGGEQIFQG